MQKPNIVQKAWDDHDIEKFLRGMANKLATGIYIVQDGKFCFTNSSFQELVGYTAEELEGMESLSLVSPEDRDMVREKAIDMLKGKSSIPYEFKYVKKDGESRWVMETVASMLYWGKPAAIGSFMDIGARRQVEEQIRHRLELEEAVIRVSRLFSSQTEVDIVEVLRILGEVVSANRAFIFQFRDNCQRLDNTFEWCSPGTEPQIDKLQDLKTSQLPFWMNKIFNGENTIVADTDSFPNWIASERGRIQAQDTCKFMVIPINIPDSNVAGFLGFYDTNKSCLWTDEDASLLRVVTEMLSNYWERRRVLATLRHSEERLRLTFASVQEGVVISDLRGNILDVNDGATNMCGYDSKEEIIGQSSFILLSGIHHEKAQKDMKETFKMGSTGITQYILLRKNGTEFPAAASSSVLRDSDGKPVGFTVLIADVTERQKRQQQLMLTDRLASIGQLASGIAHELNNPLTSVIGLSELTMEKDLPEEIKEDLESVVCEAKRAAKIIKGLLTFVRNQNTEKSWEDINIIIQDILRLRSYEQSLKNIEVDTRFEPVLPRIMVNAAQIQQVFMNLIVNAEQAMLESNGQGRLLVITERAGDMVRISFNDNGPGISYENMKRLFTPFFTTKDVGQGTGLGLSICHGIVTEHGGRIYARSNPGKGAAFIIELPVLTSTRHQKAEI